MNIETHRMISAISLLNGCEGIQGESLYIEKSIVDSILDMAQYAHSTLKDKEKIELAIHQSLLLIHENFTYDDQSGDILQEVKGLIDKIATE